MTLTRSQRRSLWKRAERLGRQWDAEHRALLAQQADELAQRRAIRDAERAAIDAAAPCDIDTLEPGDAVRDRFGWHRVVRVNTKTVTVATAWSWTDTIPHERIIETRKAVTS